MNRLSFALVLALALLTSCQRNDSGSGEDEIVVRMDGEPDRLHPMLTNVGYATDVLRLTHFPMLEFHPLTLELEPLLAESLPTVTSIDTGALAGGQAFAYRIRSEARWDDGTPVTAEDYLFTLKAAFHPLVQATAWRGFLSIIRDVVPDPADPKRFTVLTADDYFLSLPVTGNFNIYPKHVYDPQGFLDGVSLSDLADPATADSLVKANPRLVEFATQYSTDRFGRDTAFVQGAGPYRLASWTSGQELVLERKKDWWGASLQKAGEQFTAKPARIRFKFIPDDQSAVTLLRDGGIDLMGASPAAYQQFKDSLDADRIETYLPVYMQYVFLNLNNRNPKLADTQTRRALAHVVDVDQIIASVLHGLGERITGPFHPSKPYYDRSLKPLAYDPAEASRLLAEAGWKDSNGDGTVDRIIGGKRTELSLTLLIRPGSDIAPAIGLLMQQGARKAGVDIRVETRDFKLITENMARRDYDMTLLSLRQAPADDDPYQAWHSDSDRPDGSNRCAYRSAEADSLITGIRAEQDQKKRYELYRKLHAVIHRDQPVIFLYAPKEPVLARKSVRGLQPSPMRPGYYLPFLHH